MSIVPIGYVPDPDFKAEIATLRARLAEVEQDRDTHREWNKSLVRVQVQRDAALTRVAVLEAALRDINEKLECDTDCTLRPEVRCGECHQIRSGAHWCAGCVARAALSQPAATGGCERCDGKREWIDLIDGRKYPCPACQPPAPKCELCEGIGWLPAGMVDPCPKCGGTEGAT
jgi:hypothetical protein